MAQTKYAGKGGTHISRSGDVMALLRKRAGEVADRTAGAVIEKAVEIIESRGGKEGSALGPPEREQDLINSGYVVSPESDTYAEAKAGIRGEAKSRHQIADKVEVAHGKDEIVAIAAFATTFASLIHEGHKHGLGVPFLTDALNLFREAYLRDLKAIGREMESIHVTPDE